MNRIVGVGSTVLLAGLWAVTGPGSSPLEAQAPPQAAGGSAISVESLLDEMTDLRRLTTLPSPSYKTLQFSSYDRASKSPEEDWFANRDFGHFLRIEQVDGRQEHVLMDAEGPGAIVRLWSANPAGTLRIYIDGADQPAIEAPMTALLGGEFPGLPRPIAGMRAAGWNLYFPIPYARHCKVTSDEGGFYYLLNYRTYEPGTEVISFVPEDLPRLSSKINEVAGRLAEPRSGGSPAVDRTSKKFQTRLTPGRRAKLWDDRGPKAVCGFVVRLAADNIEDAARSVVLTMTFDGQQTVESPLGDFFGTAPGLIPYEGLPMGITEDGQMWSHWWMPFERRAEISLRNLGQQTVRIEGQVDTTPYEWRDDSLLLHAGWRIERDIPSRPFSDWTHLECTGQGRFVGGALHIINPVRVWWGEGDEKIYVDGETFPSWFGTGSEDYYGYAWCSPERFVHAYHNQPNCDGPGNFGNTSVNRFHVIDDIPFNRSFKFDMENWHLHAETRTTRAAVSYWYARPGGDHTFRPITAEDVVLDRLEPLVVKVVPGAIEGENMRIIHRTAIVEVQMLDERYSHEKHLWWRDGRPGDRLVLEFDVEEAGRRNVLVCLTKAIDYGIVQLYVNDRMAGGQIDLFNDGVVPTDEIDLGAFDLPQGPNRLTVQIVGANEKAVKRHMFGIDYLRLE